MSTFTCTSVSYQHNNQLIKITSFCRLHAHQWPDNASKLRLHDFINKSGYFPIVMTKYNNLRIWLGVFHTFISCDVKLSLQHVSWKLTGYILSSHAVINAALWRNHFYFCCTRWEHIFIIFWVMKKYFVIVFSSFFTARRLLCLDALKSALTMRSCHTSHMCTSIKRQKAGYCVYILCEM